LVRWAGCVSVDEPLMAVIGKKGPKLVISIFELYKIQSEKAHFFSSA
jgi:hypothetical protein